jgi:hypothetical protein
LSDSVARFVMGGGSPPLGKQHFLTDWLGKYY